MRWSLDDYYLSFEDEAFKNDLAKVDKYIDSIAKRELPDADKMDKKERAVFAEAQIKEKTELSAIVSRIMGFCSLTMSVETGNTTALSFMQSVQQKMIKLTKPNVKFQRWLTDLDDLDELLPHSKFLQDIEFSLRRTQLMSKYLLSEKEEDIISRLSMTGSTAWSRMKGYIESQHMVELEIDGETKEYPLPVIRNFAHDKDPETRKKAYEAEIASYEKIAYPACSALNAIKGEVLQKVELRGYESMLDMTLLNSRMEKRTLDTMISVIEKNLPKFREYFKKKAELLGHKGSLPFYDMFAPLGKTDKTFTFDEARQFVVDNFRTFSDKLADFADNAFEKNWIDAEPRKGKRGGAFCSTCQTIKQSRVLANFTGSLGDVTTLAHELGHAYHGHCLKDELMQNSGYSMPVAETASTFAETIVKNAIFKTVNGEEKLAILETILMESSQIIVDIYSRFLFESRFVEARKKGDVSLDKTKELMLQAQKDAYGDGLDHQYLHPYMWLCKPHYYYAGSNFYNFPYSFGLLFALGLYAQYQKDPENFIQKYDDVLRETGRNDITGVAAFAGIDINKEEFWQDSLDLIIAQIEEYLAF